MKDFTNQFVIVRTTSAGAFAGTLVEREGKMVQLTKARRLWRWSGAASLSDMALHGVSRPEGCKFPAPVDVLLTEAIEILPCTPEAQVSIMAVPVWTAH